MQELQKLIEGKEQYPPSIELWRSLINNIKGKKKELIKQEKITQTINTKITREMAKYMPSLPEPELSVFIYNNEHFYLDEQKNIYSIDNNSALVGNLIGKIDGNKVIINNKCVFELETIKVKKHMIFDVPYYIDEKTNIAHQGFQSLNKLVYEVGKFENGKIHSI